MTDNKKLPFRVTLSLVIGIWYIYHVYIDNDES